jgi:ferredoxin-NADP reductase
MNKIMEDKLVYVVTENKRENHDTVTLLLSCEKGSVPPFVPGQFISIYFPELNTPEGKSYSISGPPGKETMEITIKGIGEFSNRLCAMKRGDRIIGSSPYGFFYSEQDDTDLVMIAGGIGITPFRSMIAHALEHEPERRISLFHTVRTAADLIFDKELANVSGLATHYFVTRDTVSSPLITPRRMKPEDIVRNCRPELAEFFICGSIPFVRDLWHGLKSHGIAEDRIYTEAFFSH